jgi:dTMP kinase
VKRLEKREDREMFENLEELKKIRGRALKLVKNWFIIDTNKAIEETQGELLSILERLDGSHIKNHR